MATPASEIKEMLYRDFGYELNIGGGSGQSKLDPMTVNASTPEQASNSELLVLRGLVRGRGIFWHLLESNVIEVDGRHLVQRKIETKEFTKNQIITQTENYYFERSKAPIYSGQRLPIDIAHTDENIGLSFPSEIGWLHFEEIVDYEIRQPGLGYSLAYNAPGFKATVYVYPILERVPEHDAELKSAIDDYVSLNGNDSVEHHWGGSTDEYQSSFYFIPKGSRKELSGVTVIKCVNHFVKIRVTFYDDLEIRAFSQQFHRELLKILRRQEHTKPGDLSNVSEPS